MNFLHLNAQDAEFWYEHKLSKMSLDEKIGQLFMVAAYSNKDAKHVAELEDLIINYHIGGLIFFQDNALKQAYLTNYFQSISNTPLLIGIDGEWGLPMRLKNTYKFPYAMTLGACNNDSLLFRTGAAIAENCKRLGIHINFAPDADINTNPDNPVIGFRSFSDDKYRVSNCASAYSAGMLSMNVLSCAKHFPGHGDVNIDSHHGLPVVNKSLNQLDTLELYPFKRLIEDGIPSIMVGHINLPQLDARSNRSASLSSYVIDTLLRMKLKYDGLVFTDAMNMKGVANYYQKGHADLEALMAGNDIILFSEDVPTAIRLIKQAIDSGLISIEQLNQKVKRILKWKQFAGLDQYSPIELKSLNADLYQTKYDQLIQDVANNAVSTVNYGQQILPMNDKSKTLVISIGMQKESKWSQLLRDSGFIHHLNIGKNPNADKIASVLQSAKAYHHIIVSLHQPKMTDQRNNGFNESDYGLIRKLAASKKVCVIGFCSPYALIKIDRKATIIAAYEDLPAYMNAALGVLSGQLKNNGSSPVQLHMNTGIFPSKEFNYENLNGIDVIARQLIAKKAAPGCRILVLKDGQLAYDKSFGSLNYDLKQAVNDSTIYDIASITKIAATGIAVMKLYEEGKIDLSAKLGDYVPMAKGTNKENLVLSDIMQHRAGLTAWIPFYKETLPYIDSVYCAKSDSAFCVKVADKFFMLKANKDTIYKRIFSSALESRTYRYSDLSMILMQLVVENVSGMALDEYLNVNFYQPMGLKNITYNPWKTHDLSNIAPTQEDRLFRQQELCGYVHDPAAAMLGGVSGHAGLFSTAQDLGQLMLMLNYGGMYKGKRYLNESTIQLFTSYQRSDSRRGLIFDKPDFSGRVSPASTLGSKRMFGHTGFTGTCVWIDPTYNLVYVFLSNRICPVEDNKELINGNYRTRIQDIIYKSLD
ncbi:MAG TPA: glycoside hydrolase family 3 N-terminal domain-containing protein [Bacteroidia bacterium]